MVLSLMEMTDGFHLRCDPIQKALQQRVFATREEALAAIKKFRIPTRTPSTSKSYLKAKQRRDRIRAKNVYKAGRAALGNKC